jgi:hypothetical protein
MAQAGDVSAKPKAMQLAQSTHGSAGEGGEGGIATDAETDEVAYMFLLGQIEGHIRVGAELFQQGQAEAAKTHMKHPGDELYDAMNNAFAARKITGIAHQLEAMTAIVETGKSKEALAASMKEFTAAIRAAHPKNIEAATAARVAGLLLQLAANEYDQGVADGKVKQAHEYQDAWGFVRSARALIENLSTSEREEHAGNISEIEKHLASLDDLWPDIAGRIAVTADIKKLHVAAANVELAAYGIR